MNNRLQLCESDIKFLDDVRKYGLRLSRYDLNREDGYDDTQTVFEYYFKDRFEALIETGEVELQTISYKVIIFMKHGEYIEYYKTVVDERVIDEAYKVR